MRSFAGLLAASFILFGGCRGGGETAPPAGDPPPADDGGGDASEPLAPPIVAVEGRAAGADTEGVSEDRMQTPGQTMAGVDTLPSRSWLPAGDAAEVAEAAGSSRATATEPQVARAPTRPKATPRPQGAGAAAASPPEAPAAPPIERFVGVYAYSGGANQRNAALAAIDAALADLDPISRSLARRKLAERDPAIPTITIAFADGKTTITRLEQAVSAELDGPAAVVSRDGRSARVSHRLVGTTKLVETIKGERGVTVNTFVLAEEGRLIVSTRIEGERIKRPIAYKLSYRRR